MKTYSVCCDSIVYCQRETLSEAIEARKDLEVIHEDCFYITSELEIGALIDNNNQITT